MSKVTKRATHSEAFRTAAITDPLGALAYQFLAAFGVDLTTLMMIADKASQSNDTNLMLMAVTAAVQIRANVTFVGRDFGNFREKYPELIIEGERPNLDVYNFGALHALGHMLCQQSGTTIGAKALAKAGNCITGDGCPESEAGKINLEISKSWIPEEKVAYDAWRLQKNENAAKMINNLQSAKTSFVTKMNGGTAAAGGRAPPKPPGQLS